MSTVTERGLSEEGLSSILRAKLDSWKQVFDSEVKSNLVAKVCHSHISLWNLWAKLIQILWILASWPAAFNFRASSYFSASGFFEVCWIVNMEEQNTPKS